MVNDPAKNPLCNGEMIQYESPLECCRNMSFVPCPQPPCKISEQPKEVTFIHIRGISQESTVYPPTPGLTIPNYPFPNLRFLQTWQYEGGILACGGVDPTVAWTVIYDCRIAKPENDFAWQWFPSLHSGRPNEVQGSLLLNNVPWIFGADEVTQYFDKGKFFTCNEFC